MSYILAELHPEARDSELAREALVRMRPVLDDMNLADDEPVTITVAGGTEAIVVPKSVLDLLVRVLGAVSAGDGITVLPLHAELTTQQAADILNVSRPHLVKLLEDGRIEYRTVGTHRRVLAHSLMVYLKRDDAQRRSVADELSALAQEMDLS